MLGFGGLAIVDSAASAAAISSSSGRISGKDVLLKVKVC